MTYSPEARARQSTINLRSINGTALHYLTCVSMPHAQYSNSTPRSLGRRAMSTRLALGGSTYDWSDPPARMFLQILAVMATRKVATTCRDL